MNDREGEDREPIQEESLRTSPEVIFKEKRSFENIVSAEIPKEFLGDMGEMLDDLEAISKGIAETAAGPEKTQLAIERISEADENWQAIISENRDEGEDESVLTAKDLMRRIVFGASGILERKIEREELNQRYRTAGKAESLEIEGQTSKLNVEDVKWQQDIIVFTVAMSRNPKGREILGRFWSSFESLYQSLNPRVASSRSELTIGQQEARNLHNAVIGMVGTMILLQRNGYDPYLPEPHQDAEGKVDLWVKPKGVSWQGGFLGLQLKTSVNGVRGLEVRNIDDRFLEIMRRDPETKKDARAAKKLYDFLQEYSNYYHAPISGVWVDLTGSREEEVVDPITGEPHFRNDDSQLKDFLRVIGSHFGKRESQQAA